MQSIWVLCSCLEHSPDKNSNPSILTDNQQQATLSANTPHQRDPHQAKTVAAPPRNSATKEASMLRTRPYCHQSGDTVATEATSVEQRRVGRPTCSNRPHGCHTPKHLPHQLNLYSNERIHQLEGISSKFGEQGPYVHGSRDRECSSTSCPMQDRLTRPAREYITKKPIGKHLSMGYVLNISILHNPITTDSVWASLQRASCGQHHRLDPWTSSSSSGSLPVVCLSAPIHGIFKFNCRYR